jgi:hypothetical protein
VEDSFEALRIELERTALRVPGATAAIGRRIARAEGRDVVGSALRLTEPAKGGARALVPVRAEGLEPGPIAGETAPGPRPVDSILECDDSREAGRNPRARPVLGGLGPCARWLTVRELRPTHGSDRRLVASGTGGGRGGAAAPVDRRPGLD